MREEAREVTDSSHLRFASCHASAYTFKMQVTRRSRSACPAACALDLAGDRWTLLIVRDPLRGRDTYGALASAGEGIPTNILAERLERMAQARLITAEPYQQQPLRYRYALTAESTGV